MLWIPVTLKQLACTLQTNGAPPSTQAIEAIESVCVLGMGACVCAPSPPLRVPSFGGGRFFSKETLRYGVVLGPLPARMESASPWKLATRIATNRGRGILAWPAWPHWNKKSSHLKRKNKSLSKEHAGGSSVPNKRHLLLVKPKAAMKQRENSCPAPFP